MQSWVATISLCLSKRPLATYVYTVYDVVSIRRSTRRLRSTSSPSRLSAGTLDSSGPPGVMSMPFFRMYTKLAIEYWYTRSMTLRLSIRKYTSEPRLATGRYTSRASAMVMEVVLASSTLAAISVAVRLVSSRFSMSSMSSRISPWELARRKRRLSSRSLSVMVYCASWLTSSLACSWRSGRSFSTTSASSWSSSPFSVTQKLSIVVWAAISGL
mmetsp:Transcript_46009/g.146994  ORF Transcript_46009/g.146994 Transcript_46009/m.146994 type:complete len:214 (-) Transcript_46009:2215-2856(-)